MASLLESYQQQYSVLTADITSKTGLVSKLSGPPNVWLYVNCNQTEKKNMVQQVERLIEEANELLEQMDLEVREVRSESRSKYQNQIKSYKAELSQMGKELRRAKLFCSDEMKNRDELFEDDSMPSEDQRASLLDNTERLDRCTRKLEAGYKTSVETAYDAGMEIEEKEFPFDQSVKKITGLKQMGSDILENLYSQRQTMNKTRDTLRETDHELGKSSRIISSMTRRAHRKNKFQAILPWPAKYSLPNLFAYTVLKISAYEVPISKDKEILAKSATTKALINKEKSKNDKSTQPTVTKVKSMYKTISYL
ncbi:Vesicle transport through interaction with t-SNAREs 1A [Nymphon striatum]|nr:Vesicle transport through interaction with t-SNAREs 1A [Nymphon striatum]